MTIAPREEAVREDWTPDGRERRREMGLSFETSAMLEESETRRFAVDKRWRFEHNTR